MNWTTLLAVGLALAIIVLLKRAGQISAAQASEYLKAGALVVDLRGTAEFNSGHLSKAINIPLREIESVLPRRAKDKQQVVLLHCQSGMRSAVAAKKLKALGYANAFNLGSYARAAKIVGR
jgi:phage shock protein E